MEEKKKVSGKWEWFESDTWEQFANIAIYGAAIGGIAILEQAQSLPIDNPLVASLVALGIGAALDGLRRWKKDNASDK